METVPNRIPHSILDFTRIVKKHNPKKIECLDEGLFPNCYWAIFADGSTLEYDHFLREWCYFPPEAYVNIAA